MFKKDLVVVLIFSKLHRSIFLLWCHRWWYSIYFIPMIYFSSTRHSISSHVYMYSYIYIYIYCVDWQEQVRGLTIRCWVTLLYFCMYTFVTRTVLTLEWRVGFSDERLILIEAVVWFWFLVSGSPCSLNVYCIVYFYFWC